MKLIVQDHDIAVIQPARLVSGSVKLVSCQFSFNESWEGYVKTAVFATLRTARAVPLVDDRATIPWEVLQPGQRLRIGVFGVKGDSRLPTVYTQPMPIELGAEDAAGAQEPTPDKWEQLLAAIEVGGTGPQGPQGEKGEKGDKGEKGMDGVSPRVTLGRLSSGAIITVDDAYGHTTVRLYDGEEGATGPRGPQGVQGIPGEKGDTGEKGDAGYTPVKGTDYFTEADKAELVSRVTAALSSEQWTFELEDGSTITRNVVIQ